jgi:hypothetical protein
MQTAPSSAPVASATVDYIPPSYIPVVEFSGNPASIGAQHGHRFDDVIHLLYEKYLLVQVPPSEITSARLAAASFETQMLPEHRDEVAALAQACQMNPLDMALAQCFLDLSDIQACSTITLPPDASPDHVARFGRNLDFPSLDLLDKYSAVMIYHPQGKFQFAVVGWPGLIGVLSGMNEYGLCLSNMEVDREPRLPEAMPYSLLYRCVLEQCRTVDEAIAFLQKTPRQSANNLMLMDATGKRAVAEIRPEGVNVRWGIPGSPLISTNHQRNQDYNSPGLCWRYDSLNADAKSHFGQIDKTALESMLGKVVQGDHGDMTLQSMVFEPANLVIYLAAGADAPSHPYQRIDLKPIFQAGALR